jgi:predicted RNase H-like HicB family nuclease
MEPNKYRMIIAYSSEKEAFVARVPELPDCQVEAPTRGEVIAEMEQALEDRLQIMEQQGAEPPPPLEELEFDGELSLKVTPELHRDLAFLARSRNVELPTLLVELLTRAASQRWSGGGKGRPRHDRGGRSREGQGQRYHDIMENRADFIEYVRGLDQGGGRPGGKRGGGRGGRRGKR